MDCPNRFPFDGQIPGYKLMTAAIAFIKKDIEKVLSEICSLNFFIKK